MNIGKEKIMNLANQIYLGLTDDEAERLSSDIMKIEEECGDILSVNVDNVIPDVAVLEGCNNAFRKDEVVCYEDAQGLLQSAKEVEDNMYKLPKIV